LGLFVFGPFSFSVLCVFTLALIFEKVCFVSETHISSSELDFLFLSLLFSVVAFLVVFSLFYYTLLLGLCFSLQINLGVSGFVVSLLCGVITIIPFFCYLVL